MALTDADWNRVYEAIQRSIPNSEMVVGKVIKSDKLKKLIWLDEFGDQPIPIVAFRATVKVYDTQPTGTTTAVGSAVRKVTIPTKYKVEVEVPKAGDLVVVLRQFGSRRLPKCVGVVLSSDYVI